MLRNRHQKSQTSSSPFPSLTSSSTLTPTNPAPHLSSTSSLDQPFNSPSIADTVTATTPDGSAEMASTPREINLVTLNCWGLKALSKLRNERLATIGQRLAASSPSPDIVCLQECWCQDDYEAIRRETRFVLPYGKFYFSGSFGGGLAILSRWPIEESSMRAYPLNGRPTAFWRGDWYVGKGIAWAMIRYGPGRRDVVEVFNTHTHAPYESGPKDSYICHRLSQSWEISKLLRAACDRGHLVLAMGDFNMIPLSFPHRLITANAPVRDIWRVLHPDSAIGPYDNPSERARQRPLPTAHFNVSENGVTSDSAYNSWRWAPAQQKQLFKGAKVEIAPETKDRRGKRLDYIFASTGLTPDSPPGTAGWVVKDSRVGMIEPHETIGCSLSDHFSVEATLALHTPSTDISPVNKPVADLADQPSSSTSAEAVDPLIRFFDNQLHGSAVPDAETSLLTGGTYDDILDLTRVYMRRQKDQRYWQGFIFYLSLFIFVGCLVGVWWSPYPWVSFLLLFCSSLFLVFGVISGLICLLFGGAEKRALMEFEWEIMNAKAGGDISLHAGGGMGAAALSPTDQEKIV
ncbi:Inositol phosphosphingolipids phospholipase C [Ceratocystis lukuohia]